MSEQILKIDKEIYKEEIIKQAIEDFKNVAKIIYSDTSIKIEGEGDLEEIQNEFMNYCIGLQNELI
ncbi:MAG: HxsD-like protein [Candidatus Gracilibacteria bacterium]